MSIRVRVRHFSRNNRLQFENRTNQHTLIVSFPNKAEVHASLIMDPLKFSQGFGRSIQLQRIIVSRISIPSSQTWNLKECRHSINLAAILVGIKGLDLTFFERRGGASKFLEKAALELGDNPLSDAIFTVLSEKKAGLITTFGAMPKNDAPMVGSRDGENK
jgi:hypothetical protein